ncbi:hypothetical protein SDC9_145285 [bioreactor metagenome]|uniref:Galactokinase n=1 Tax=bioreactor metagenome TaxID=1076179 RepID=A0A645E811_9ZZZZ
MTETYLMKTSGAFRVHGGGLGGTILVVMSRNAAPAYQDYIESIFGAGSCLVLNIRHKGSVCVI